MTSEVVLGAVILVLAAAAAEDLARLRISNLFPILVVSIFIVWVFVRGWEADLWMNLVSFAATLAIGTLLFSIGWLGGGDVKLLAAMALWFDSHGIIWLVVMTAIAGGFVTFALYGFRRMVPKRIRSQSSMAIFAKEAPIPYGVAIAIGGSLALLLSGPNPALRDRPPPAQPFLHWRGLAPASLPGGRVDDQLGPRSHI